MAPALPFVIAAGAAISAVGAIQQANMASKADKFNADVATRNAGITADQTTAALTQQQNDTYRKLGAIKAGFGASGVASSGSPMDVLSDSYTQSELDANTIAYNGKLKEMGFTDSANQDVLAASNAKISGYTTAAAKLLGGSGNASSAYNTVGSGSTNTAALNYNPNETLPWQ